MIDAAIASFKLCEFMAFRRCFGELQILEEGAVKVRVGIVSFYKFVRKDIARLDMPILHPTCAYVLLGLHAAQPGSLMAC
jgi:hypothetical protein